MAEWATFTPADLFPTEMAALLSDASSLADTLGSALELAADVVDLAAAFIAGVGDLNTALIEAMQASIQSVIQALTETGVYALNHIPSSPGLRVNPQVWLSDVSASLNDTFDSQRPILVDPGAYVGAILVVGVAPDYRQLMTDLYPFLALFGATLAELEQILRMKLPGETPTLPAAGVGRAPDWRTLRAADIVPALGEIAKSLQSFSDAITAAAAGSAIYTRFAELLRVKAAALRDFATKAANALIDLASALAFSGAYILPIYGQGDAAWLQAQILSSTGGPLDVDDAQFSAGFMFLATGGTSTPADVLFGLFGVTP